MVEPLRRFLRCSAFEKLGRLCPIPGRAEPLLLPQLGVPKRGVGRGADRKTCEQPGKEVSQRSKGQIEENYRRAEENHNPQSGHEDPQRSRS